MMSIGLNEGRLKGFPGEKYGFLRKMMPGNDAGIVKRDTLEMKIGDERW